MEGLKLVPYIALLLAITGVIVGAGVMTTSSFGDTVTKCHNGSYTFNSSTAGNYFCSNSTNLSDGSTGNVGSGNNFSSEYFVVSQSLDGQLTIAEQLPTVAIIAIMVIIISIIAGVFVYMQYFA